MISLKGIGLLSAALCLGVNAGACLAQQTTPAAARPAHLAETRALDLRTPPIDHVMSRSQIAVMANADVEMPVDIMVERAHYKVEPPVGFFRSIPWAVTHPLSAWRVLAPVPPMQ